MRQRRLLDGYVSLPGPAPPSHAFWRESSTRHEGSWLTCDGLTGILLDANENALGPSLSSSSPSSSKKQTNGSSSSPSSNGTTAIEDALQVEDYAALELNRYPDPVQGDIKDRFSDYRGFRYGRKGVFLGVGSDEIIDLLIRVTCTPGQEQGDKLLGAFVGLLLRCCTPFDTAC